MMFKFNFSNEEENSENNFVENEKLIEWYDSKEICISDHIKDMVKAIPRDQIITLDYGNCISYFCLSAKEVMNILKENSDNEKFLDVLKADNKHSDLLPGKYEGGLKTWECTKDLVLYFINNELKNLDGTLKGKRVLDLGCGSGILGIMSILHGADVTFQDYNQEVLEAMTIPNIFLNCHNIDVVDKVKFYSGDWSSFVDLIIQTNTDNDVSEDWKFDYILTSETIYNPDNYKKIIKVFKNLLKHNGIAFIAAKVHYFGVGGNFKEFQNQIRNSDLIGSICWETVEGVARAILKVELHSDFFEKKLKS